MSLKVGQSKVRELTSFARKYLNGSCQKIKKVITIITLILTVIITIMLMAQHWDA